MASNREETPETHCEAKPISKIPSKMKRNIMMAKITILSLITPIRPNIEITKEEKIKGIITNPALPG